MGNIKVPMKSFYAPQVLMFDEMLDFDFLSCPTRDELVRQVLGMADAANRSRLYLMYKVGELASKSATLKAKYGITINELATDYLGVGGSAQNIHRCKKIYNFVTKDQLRKLASRAVSGNAILYLVEEVKNDEDREELLDSLITGSLRAVVGLRAEHALKLQARNDAGNIAMLSGGGDAEALKQIEHLYEEEQDETEKEFDEDGHEIISGEVIGADEVPADLGFDDDGDENAHTPPKSTADRILDDGGRDRVSRSDGTSAEAARQMYRNWKAGILPLRRELNSIASNMNEQLAVTDQRSDVIAGDEDAYEEFACDTEALIESAQCAVESLMKAILWGKKRGYIRRPFDLPEGETLSSIFS